jgi:hypothetical protein
MEPVVMTQKGKHPPVSPGAAALLRLSELAQNVPIEVAVHDGVVRAVIAVPQLGRKPFLIVCHVPLAKIRISAAPTNARVQGEEGPEGDDEIGWFGSSFVRKTAGGVKDAGKATLDVAKKVAKNKAVKMLAETAPQWSQAIPPPYGPAISAGITAGQTVNKVVQAAKAGDKRAQAVVAEARKVQAERKGVGAAVTKAVREARARNAPRTEQRRIVETTLTKDPRGAWRVRSPTGREFRFTNEQLAK